MSDAHDGLAPLLSAYLDGELDPARRRQVEAHLTTCATCSQELANLRAGDQALAGLQTTPTAPNLHPRVRRHLRQQVARTALRGGLLAVIVVLVRSLVQAAAILKRRDLPVWGRLGIMSGNMLLAAPGIALCVDLVRDVRALAEYAWLSDESNDAEGSQP